MKKQTSVLKTLGSPHRSKYNSYKREINDYYATDPQAVHSLLKLENFSDNILEPACGEGHISKVLSLYNKNVTSSDLIDRGFGIQKDFFSYTYWDGDIITNPPYKYALEFIQHSLKIINKGNKAAFFLRLLFLVGKKRKIFFEFNPPKIAYVSSSRIICAKNGNFENIKSSPMVYAWFIWEKGFKGNTILKWF
jgi:hypothetical protein